MGFFVGKEGKEVGRGCVRVGGGRKKKEDSVDPAVGIELHKKVGDSVLAGEPICTLYYNSELRAAQAKLLIEHSYHIAETAPPLRRPLIHKIIQPEAPN